MGVGVAMSQQTTAIEAIQYYILYILADAGVETCVEINQCVGCTINNHEVISRRRRGRAGSVERRGTGIATPSSRRRVDGVEDDAAIQHERAVKF